MNPFERFDIDPMQGPGAITERLRELSEEADEAAREELRAQWEELTMHPRRRLQIALEAFPETRPPPGPPPRAPVTEQHSDEPLRLSDLVSLPRVAAVLPPLPAAPRVLAPLAADPLIDRQPGDT